MNDFVERLIAATEVPPEDTSVDALLVAFDVMISRRARLLAEAGMTKRQVDPELVAELERRNALWLERLDRAAKSLSAARRANGQLRAYAGR